MGVVGRVVDPGTPALVGKCEFEHLGPGSAKASLSLSSTTGTGSKASSRDWRVRENNLAPLALICTNVEEHRVLQRRFPGDSFDYPPLSIDVDVSLDIAPRHHIAPAEFVKRAAQYGPVAGVP